MRELGLVLVGALALGCRPEVVPPAPAPPAPAPPVERQTERPRLVVLVVVDQMRGDYLERFGPLFTGGFARLRRDGAVFTEAHHQHAITFTAAGHATLSTGVHPSRHGMIANRFVDRSTGHIVEITDDPTAKMVGNGRETPQSPRRIRREGLSDWLRAASPGSLAYSLALKSRAAVCAGGQHPTGVFWHDQLTGEFVSSSHYMDALPAWLVSANQTLDGAAVVAGGWDRIRPAADYAMQEPDDRPHELGGKNNAFPHSAASLLAMDGGNPHRALRWMPQGNDVTLDVAGALLRGAGLGADEKPDLLVLSLSSPDYVGHRYGPNSHEVLDTYLRLDGLLGRLFATLDEVAGEDGWTVVLTSDHGVMPLPESIDGGRRLSPEEMYAALDTAMAAASKSTGVRAPPAKVSDGVYLLFDRAVPAQARREFRRALARELGKLESVAHAYAADGLADGTAEGPFLEAYRRSLDPERSPDVFVLLEPNHLYSGFSGTSHGSPYRYDTHVPLVLLGAGVEPGTHAHAVGAADVAPTVARLLGVTPPDDIDGQVLDVALSP